MAVVPVVSVPGVTAQSWHFSSKREVVITGPMVTMLTGALAKRKF
jgi:hypothetical protein